jgi:predicted GNAT superfamily acetyltransferase
MEGDPWARAQAAAAAAGVQLRALDRPEDADLVTGVMVATWGEHQLLPRELIRAFQASGNAPYGAFHDDRIVGYVLGFLGADDDGLHMHSHMLATLPEWQSRGVGYALKLAQRAVALDAGLRLVRWTFDPLLSRNAHFNIAKLGARADRFHRDFYGEMTDLLNRGDRSDRLVVRWELDREATGAASSDGVEVLGREGSEDLPRPSRVEQPTSGPALVRIPRDYPSLRERDRALADAWREAAADAIEACLAAGLAVAGFTADSAYVFA